jgi:hypothetical protein
MARQQDDTPGPTLQALQVHRSAEALKPIPLNTRKKSRKRSNHATYPLSPLGAAVTSNRA